LGVRILIVLVLALALAGLNLLRPTSQRFVIVAVDDSLSVGQDARSRCNAWLDELEQSAAGHELAYLDFAKEPSRVRRERATTPPANSANSAVRNAAGETTEGDNGPAIASANPQDRAKASRTDPARMGTNLAAAIETAQAALPPFFVPEIVLITDGNETHGNALRAAVAGDVRISTVALPTRDDPEIQVSEVLVPAQVRQGEPFFVEVVVDSNHEDEVSIDIYRGDVRIDQEQTNYKLKQGENRFRFRQEVTDQRLVNYTARISGGQDKLLDNNSAAGLVSAAGKPRVLLIDSDTKGTDHLRWALEEQDINVDVRPPEGIPSALSDLQNYEVILLSNVPATSLFMRQMEVMRTYVQDLGGGLIMLGGDQSFGLGGYYKTTIEEILPVRSDFEKEKEKPSLAMVFVIDRSGSMGGMKMELAKDAAKSAVELLGSRDQVGVIAFDSSAYWVCDLRSASDKSYIVERISTIDAGGGTSIYPGMSDAYDALSTAIAKLKHVILLTDGHSSPGDFDGIVNSMVSERITVSTVAVGSGADQELLERMARDGGGRYYFCDDPSSIPQIFAKETVTASKSAINEQPFVPQLIRPTPVLNTLDIESAPFLLGFVTTRPKPTSEFVLATESGEPLLAWWRYGLGMTVAFTSDAKSRWAAEWLSWPDFGTFWAQLVRHAMRKSDARGVYVEVTRDGDQTELRLDSVDDLGRFRNNAQTKVRVIGPQPGDDKNEVEMQQVAPGRYVARVKTADEGAYHFDLSQWVGGQAAFRQTRGMIVGYPEELRLRTTNEELLRRIADVTGGQYNVKPQDLFADAEKTAHRAQPLWPFLVTAALVLFVLDVALRRVDFSLLI
ncbi:MAG: VWA domain-containing protein, partial [Planctomycetales bacterium]|nr:VWA domain-containing protein [Planctomycetales bacterium]